MTRSTTLLAAVCSLAAVCAAPRYTHIINGSCSAARLVPIRNTQLCQAAIQYVGLDGGASSSTALPVDRSDCSLNGSAFPPGCLVLELPHSGLYHRRRRIGRAPCYDKYMQLNHAAHSSTNRASRSAHGPLVRCGGCSNCAVAGAGMWHMQPHACCRAHLAHRCTLLQSLFMDKTPEAWASPSPLVTRGNGCRAPLFHVASTSYPISEQAVFKAL